jgi:hypothetical protein
VAIEAKIVSPTKIEKVDVVWPSGYQKTTNYVMEKFGNFQYKVNIPANKLYGNSLNYHIVVYTNEGSVVFPDNSKGNLIDWDFVPKERYSIQFVEPQPTLVLFDASQQLQNDFLWPNWKGYRFEKTAYKLPSQNVLKVETNTRQAEHNDFTFKILVNKIIHQEANNLNEVDSIFMEAASSTTENQQVQIALQQQNGLVFGKIIELTPDMQQFTIPFSELKPVRQVLLPRPYPGFQAYWFSSLATQQFDISTIEAIQISIPHATNLDESKDFYGILIRTILLK